MRSPFGTLTHKNDLAQTRELGSNVPYQGIERFLDDQGTGFCIVELVLDFPLFIRGIHWCEHRSQTGNPIQTNDIFGTVGHVQGHPIPLLHP